METLNGPFFRIYREANKTPMFFGKTLDYRFDSANGECGVLYAVPELDGAFVETFMQELGRTSVSLKELRERPVALIYSKRPLRFIDLCAKGGQMRLGLDGRICTGSYVVAQAWSDALRKHPEKPDGILKEGTRVLFSVSRNMIEDIFAERVNPDGPIPDRSGYQFVEARLNADQWLQIRGDQDARLSPCHCFIPALKEYAKA